MFIRIALLVCVKVKEKITCQWNANEGTSTEEQL